MKIESLGREPSPGRWLRPARRNRLSWVTANAAFWPSVARAGATLVFASPFPIARPAATWTLVGVLSLLRFVARHRRLPKDRLLAESLEDPHVCLVSLTVYRNREPIGGDRGVAWFEDGRSRHCGHRTSFALGGEDVLPLRLWPTWRHARREGTLPDRFLPLRQADGTSMIEIAPLPLPGPRRDARSDRLVARLVASRRDRTPSQGPRHWPPLEAG